MQRTRFGGSNNKDRKNIKHALDGESYSKLTELVSIDALRVDGVFFTSSNLSELAITKNITDIASNHIFLDPTCGTGNLLTKCAKFLPIEKSLEATLMQWGKQLIGRDINPSFIKSARKRIALLAIQKGAKSGDKKKLPLAELLPQIKVGDALKERSIYLKATHIVTNPPYYMSTAFEDCAWGKGKINMAAVFIEKCLKHAKENTRIIAILPDVLRSGTRYEKWRKDFVSSCHINDINLFGQFDKIADVDVFVLDSVLTKNNSDKFNWGHAEQKLYDTISDNFNVHVGPVVPHRHPNKGKWYPYIHARNIEPWCTITNLKEHRRFKGTTFKPPFVVIRRTSRPDERNRAIATIINNEREVAIENHLIVCIPKKKTISECKKLLALLKNADSNAWLNNRIRCRHLTVEAIKEVPWRDA